MPRWSDHIWRKLFEEDEPMPSFIFTVFALGAGGLAVVLSTIAVFSVLDRVESFLGLH